MAHNGNVANYRELRDELYRDQHRLLNSDCDLEIILNLFAESLAHERTRALEPEHIFRAVEAVYAKVRGGYSVVAYIAGQGLVAFRDPYGIKPLVYGVRRDGLLPSYAFASETVSLNIMNFGEIKDVEAGEVVFIDKTRTLHRKHVREGCLSPCLFEWVYFARPDTFIDKVNVYKCRVNLGRSLAAEIRRRKLAIDVVVPVPDSARDAAIEIARKLNLKYSEALVKNRYIGRTFIMPAADKRRSSVRQKLNAIAGEVRGKNVLLVDDSIVRGNTSRAIIEMIRECGARKVYFAAYSPPLRYPCVYGIDMQTRTEFIARGADEKLVAKRIGADEVIYQTLAHLKKAVQKENPKLTASAPPEPDLPALGLTGDVGEGDAPGDRERAADCTRNPNSNSRSEVALRGFELCISLGRRFIISGTGTKSVPTSERVFERSRPIKVLLSKSPEKNGREG
jgi:amidophosphoribosyltransferase